MNRKFYPNKDNVMLLLRSRVKHLREECLKHKMYIEHRLTEPQRKRMNGKELVDFKTKESINTITKDVDMKINWLDLIIKTHEIEHLDFSIKYLETYIEE